MASFTVTYWTPQLHLEHLRDKSNGRSIKYKKYLVYEGWNFNNGNYLFTTDTK